MEMALDVSRFNSDACRDCDVVGPSAFETNRVFSLEDNNSGTSIQEPWIQEEVIEEIVVMQEEIVLEHFDDEIVDSGCMNSLTIEETVEDIIPENYRLIPHTSYEKLKKVMDTFMASKRRTRDAENIDSFITDGPKAGCARIDALYKVRVGIKSHIAVQENEQYWAEQQKLFPHLKQLHEEEAT